MEAFVQGFGVGAGEQAGVNPGTGEGEGEKEAAGLEAKGMAAAGVAWFVDVFAELVWAKTSTC